MTTPFVKEDLPRRRWQSVPVSTMSDRQRRRAGLSHAESIQDVLDAAGVEEAVAYAYEKGIIAMDTETSGLDPFLDRIVLVQLGDEERQFLIWWNVIPASAKARLVALWTDPEIPKVGFNLKFDAKMFLGQVSPDALLARPIDCLVLEQILNCGLMFGDIGGAMRECSMGETSKRWLGLELDKAEEVRTGWELLTPGQWEPPVEAWERLREEDAIPYSYEEWLDLLRRKRYYAADDCVIPMRVFDCSFPWLERLGLGDTCKLEMQFLPVLAEMEMQGLPIDRDAWAALAQDTDAELAKAQATLDRLFKVEVTTRTDFSGNREITRDKNYDSPDELGDLIRAWMWEHEKVDVLVTNAHLRESLERAGVAADTLDRVFVSKMVPSPTDPQKREKVGYPNMNDYLLGSDFVENAYARFRRYLPAKHFILDGTDSKVLRLMKILRVTPDEKIDTLPTIPTKIGLPPELVDAILAFRRYTKRRSQYHENWFDLIHPATGRVHTDTTQTAADTGRLTTRPNYQNIPAVQEFRTAVCTVRGDRRIVGADLSQIEPRIIAEGSDCAMYQRVFWSERPGTPGFDRYCKGVTEPLDLYGTVGAQIGTLPPDAEAKSIAKLPENKKGRAKSKIAVLGLGYGTGKDKFHLTMCLDMGEYIPRDESDRIFDSFWEAAHEVKDYLNGLSDLTNPERSKRRVYHPYLGEKVTYSETFGGRKRFFRPDSNGWWTVGRNHRIQGTGADILKAICVAFRAWTVKHGIDARLLLTAHDEVIIEAHADVAEQVARTLEKIMSRVGQRYCPHVPISAESYVSDHWVKD